MDYLTEGVAWRSVLIMMADQVSYKSDTSEGSGNTGKKNPKGKETVINNVTELREKIKADARLWE